MNIIVAAHSAPTSHGGLSHYQVALANALAAHNVNVRFVSAVDRCGAEARFVSKHPYEIRPQTIFGEPTLTRKLFWIRLATRPRYHSLLERWIRFYYRQKLNRFDWSKTGAVHYVGTGWDMFGFAIQQLCKDRGIPLSILPAVHPFSWGDDVIDLRFYKRAKNIVVLSRSEADHLKDRGVSSNTIVRIGLAPACRMDGDGNRLRNALGLGDRPIALFIARREQAKGFDALITAWKQVLAAIPTACLIIVGPEGTDKSIIQQIPPQSVCDLGVASEEVKADALDACNVMCVPSAHESFGIVYVEAWAYGKPVICGTAPAARELVEDRQTGLWSSQDPVELAEALISILRDRSLSDSMGEAGRLIQAQRYTWDAVVKQHIEMLGWK